MDRALRVGHLITTADRRGAETFGSELAAALDARGLHNEVRALRPATRAAALDVQVLGDPLRSAMAWQRLRRWAVDLDVVLAHGSRTLAVAGLCLRRSTPFVYVNIGDALFWASSAARRTRVRLFLRRATAVAAISPRTATALIERFGLPPEVVTVIPNGRDPGRFIPAGASKRAEARLRLALPPEADVVAFIGSLTGEKRVNLVIDSVARIDGAMLLVAGDGPLRAQLEMQADATLPGRSRFLGDVGDVRAVLSAADAIVLASSTEGIPGVLIEAGMAGVPAVSTDVGMVSDVVLDGVTGRLVGRPVATEIADALSLVIRDREAMGQAAHEHCVARFSMSTVAERYRVLLLRSVAGQYSPVRSSEYPRGGSDVPR